MSSSNNPPTRGSLEATVQDEGESSGTNTADTDEENYSTGQISGPASSRPLAQPGLPASQTVVSPASSNAPAPISNHTLQIINAPEPYDRNPYNRVKVPYVATEQASDFTRHQRGNPPTLPNGKRLGKGRWYDEYNKAEELVKGMVAKTIM
jgi:hypothetical protein